MRTFLLLTACCLISAASGGAAGYFAALRTPAQAGVAVIDLFSAAKSVDPKGDPRDVQAVAEQAKAVADRLSASGLVVLDSASVISAPDHAVVRLAPVR